MGMSSFFMMFLLSASGGDLVTIVDPADYFKTRNIAVSADKMVALATTDPADAKTQLQQLLALRWLAANAGNLKNRKDLAAIQKKIEAVAKGEMAQDLQGFAAEYATRAAVALGSKMELPTRKLPKDSVRREAINWFPKSATFVAAFDFLHGLKGAAEKDVAQMRDRLFAMMPPNAKDQIYTELEKLGNGRIDRFAIAIDDANPGSMKIYLRVTGKASHQWVLNSFRQLPMPNLQIKEIKTFRGRKISIIESNSPPVFVLVGNNDLIMAGYDRSPGNHKEVADEMLAVRRGKKDSAEKGALAAQLKSIPAEAVGMSVGTIPAELRNRLMQIPGIRSLPKTIVANMTVKKDKLHVQLTSKMDNANDANNLVADVENLKKMALQSLQNPQLPPGFPVPPKFFDNLRDTVKSIKVEAKGQDIRGSMQLTPQMIGSGSMLPWMFMGVRTAVPAPGAQPPPRAVPPPASIRQ